MGDPYMLELPQHVSLLQLSSQLLWGIAASDLLEINHLADQLLLRLDLCGKIDHAV